MLGVDNFWGPSEVLMVGIEHGLPEWSWLLGGKVVERAQLQALVGVRVLHVLVGVHHSLHVEGVTWERVR